MKKDLEELIEEFPDIWAKSYMDIKEGSKLRPAEIKLKEGVQFQHHRTYRVSPKAREQQSKCVDELLAAGLIEEYKDPVPFLNNLVLIKKSNGKTRVCLDLRQGNIYTENENFRIPVIEDLLLGIAEARSSDICMSLIDLYSAYNQVLLQDESKKMTCFMSPRNDCTYCLTRLPQGAKNSVSSFQRRVAEIFQSVSPLRLFVYLDDILVVTSRDQHVQQLREIFQILRKYNLKASPEKMQLAKTSLKYMGYQLSADGIKVEDERINVLKLIKPPTDLHSLRRVLGQFQYFSKTIPNYHQTIDPMRKLLKKDVPFKWTKECQAALDKVKEDLAKQTTLNHPDTNRSFRIAVDASRQGIGYCIFQQDLQT